MVKLQLQSRKDGVVIPIRAKPASRRNAIEGVHDGALRVHVSAAPERGRANKAICELLAKTLGVSKSQVALIAGEASPTKRVLVSGKTAGEIDAALQHFADG